MFSFYKMQVAGSDFIIVDFLERRLEYSFKLFSKYLCDRHFGVGGDGTIFLEKSEIADFKIKIFDKFGEEIEFCVNGILCIAKYVYENKAINKTQFDIETKSEIVKIEVQDSLSEIEVDVGIPKFDLEDRYNSEVDNAYCDMLAIENLDIHMISLGEMYLVIFSDNIFRINIEQILKKLEDYKYFGDNCNIVFAQIVDEENIKVRNWKRNIGEVLSSGTGACAAAAVANKYKSISGTVNVNSLGGIHKILCEKSIKLKGNAENVFLGKIVI